MKEGGLGEWGREEGGGEQRGRKPCAAAGEGAMGAMKVGGEAEEVGGDDEESLWSAGGEAAAGRAGGRRGKREAEEGTEGGTAPPAKEGLVLGAAGGAGGELGVDGVLVLAVGAAQVGVELGAVAFEFAERAAGGLAAGEEEEEEEVGAVVFTAGAAGAASGGEEDLGLSPAEGDGALTSSTGLFVLFLCDRLLSPPFFFPPSPCEPS